jgi:hypothetical protein
MNERKKLNQAYCPKETEQKPTTAEEIDTSNII